MKASEIASILQALIARKLPVFIWGAPGIGKSSVVKQTAQKAGLDFLDVRLSLLDPTDLKGIPFFDAQTKRGVWAPPSFLPHDPKSRGILFLDEINTAPPAVQASAYQLILDRKVGEYELPEGWAIVAAGNRENDRGVVYKMPPPLANRFVHLQMQADFDDWKAWAYGAGIDASIIAFLAYDTSMLFTFDPQSDEKAFATPRSWEYVDGIVKSAIPASLMFASIEGAVGHNAATAYMSFKQVMHRLPDIGALLRGELETIDEEDPKVLTALCIGLVNALRDNPDTEGVERAVRLSLSLPGEFAVMLIKDMRHAGIDVESAPSWDVWVEKFAYLLA
jgi:hypothetical protein